MIPTGVLTSYNEQVALHMKNGFFALLLLITVDRHVSDYGVAIMLRYIVVGYWSPSLFCKTSTCEGLNPTQSFGN